MRKGWEIKSVGECFESIRNGATIKQERGATGIPITRIETLSGGVFNRDRLGYANILSAEKYSSYILDDGDMLLSHINSKTYIGRTVVYNRMDNEEIIHGMNLLRLKTIRTILSPYYAFYCFKSDSFRNQIASYRKDAVNQSSIPVSDLKKIAIPVPPLPEQEKIVSELDCLSGIIEKKRQQLKELDTLAQSIFYEMFGNPVDNERGWEVKKLGEVCSFINGYAFKSQLFVEQGDKILRISNIQDGYVDITDAAHFNKQDYPKVDFEKYAVLPNDIVIALSGATTGKLGINKTDNTLYLNQRVAICREKNNDINHVYLLFYLMKQSASFLDTAAGVAQPNLSTEQMKTYLIGIPPMEYQQSFAQKIEAIEQQKALIKQSIAEVETLFNARMQEYFE